MVCDRSGNSPELGGRFDTQKDLADFLGITPQTLSRELKLCRLIFRWKERNVQVVNQSLMRYEIFSPENELVGRVKSKAELARFLGVSRQAVSAAMTRSIPQKFGAISSDKDLRKKKS